MSEYEYDPLTGQPVEPSIFTTPEVEEPPAPKIDTRDKLAKNASAFHQTKAVNNGEPDWAGMLLNAKDMAEKFRIRSAREAYVAEVKYQRMNEIMQAEKARIAEVLRTPIRNKSFYAELQRNDAPAYWSVEVQRQMKTDKAQLGLAFHLKGK
ncbi:hypothetical protein [Thiobacillus sp.]|uniref:hypothetical protein n=1 Tax=Thiobacillus sp. TaxID=924 RepID=UPI0025D25D3B|nr:hypothetical protein [Thiobacillus sp.]MBT9540381.1 hypothetical protein [Thiobacillus sp.]